MLFERELLFRARGLTKIYLAGDVSVRALNEVDLDLFEEELVVLLGPVPGAGVGVPGDVGYCVPFGY